QGVDLADLVVCQIGGDEVARRTVDVGHRSVVPREPVGGALGEDLPDAFVGTGMPGGQFQVAPVHSVTFGGRGIPRVVGVGKAHPAEPVLVLVEAVQPVDDPVGDPVGVVVLACHRVVRGPARPGRTSGGGRA